jgi:excinuclease ABC subunit A
VGLDYLQIGQPSPTLSGGEAQRIKLARELVKKSTGSTLYLLDEPTTGLHFADVQMLLNVLQAFATAGNTVLVVEHNLDVIKTADWIIDLGPEGGAGGGRIVATGTPEQVAKCSDSYTGKALAKLFAKGTNKLTPLREENMGEAKRVKRVPELATQITVRGATQHNLKSVDVNVDRDKMTVFCGPSGSGKSSLAMDTIYAEGQRRYVESLSSYARQFVNQMQKPRVEHIDGLSPAIAIEQKNLGSTPRSTVGTVTEIYDYFRILLSRLGTPFCPACDLPVGTQTSDEIVDKILKYPAQSRLFLMAPLNLDVNTNLASLFDEIRGNGFTRVRIDGTTMNIDEVPELDRKRRHKIEIVVDRIVVKNDARSRIAESVEATLAIGKGVMHLAVYDASRPEPDWEVVKHSQHLACDQCGRSFERLNPHNFSFNSQLGWCSACQGLGTQIGANPAALLRDSKLTLREGALLLWPDLNHVLAVRMLESLSEQTRIPLDVPFDQLTRSQRRMILHGTMDRWFDVTNGKTGKQSSILFRFQFKGMYPALDEASKLSPQFRAKLERFTGEVECSACDGSRLREDAAAVRFQNKTMGDYSRMSLTALQQVVKSWQLDKSQRKVAGELIREIDGRVEFLLDVGLEYLSLGRTAISLSNGEAQRIRLASQLGSGLCGVLYVLDEPIGLHPRDNGRLLKALQKLRDLGNTLLVVEHDKEIIRNSDALCDFGPRAGKHGGQILAIGTPAQVAKTRGSVTGPYLNDTKIIPIPSNRRPGLLPPETWDEGLKAKPKTASTKTTAKKTPSKKSTRTEALPAATPLAQKLTVRGARHNNLKNVSVDFPLGTLTAVTGPSGCGKSSLVNDVMYNALARRLHRASTEAGAHDGIQGLEHINKVIQVDQQPLGNTPTSNPATYSGAFELIRFMFAQLPDAKVRGYSARRFSFNVPGGRCETCQGAGQKCIEMFFLPDVWVKCDVCQGRRYNEETLGVKFKGKSISDVLEMSCGEAADLFKNVSKIHKVLQTLCDVGLDYLKLGQSAPTLSGGEAQRVKLAAELARPDTGRTLYVLDEPTTGLQKLLEVMHRLVDLGNTVLLIEHNLDVIKSADWVIDMGPEAGYAGGQVVTYGTPEMVADYAIKAKNSKGKMLRSYTGEALAALLVADHYRERKTFVPSTAVKETDIADDILVEAESLGESATSAVPWEVDGKLWHTKNCLDRNGKPVNWDGRILEFIVDQIEAGSGFDKPEWNHRSVVEVKYLSKAHGWFFHALTADRWLLKLKFRVRRGMFKRETLTAQIPLKTLNQMQNLPVYSNEPRIKVKNLSGPFQEVEMRIHNFEEIDNDGFRNFLNDAIQNLSSRESATSADLDKLTPWKKLGQRWHTMPKGFPPRQAIAWDLNLVLQLQRQLDSVAKEIEWDWTNKVIANASLPGIGRWAIMQTKKPDALVLYLKGPKGAFAQGQVIDLGRKGELESANDGGEYVRIEFQTNSQLKQPELMAFLKHHVQTVKQSLSS